MTGKIPPSVFRPGLFSDQVAVVTGGGTGIGLCMALELAQLGAQVALVSRKQKHLDAGLASIQAAGFTAGSYVCDIRERDMVEATVSAIVADYGRIDLLVNNAGGQFPSRAEDLSWNGWKAVIDTNLNGTFSMTQVVALRSMIPNRRGAVVNILANMWNGLPMMAHTAAARAGVDNLTKTLAVEWGRYGIRVNSVAPGTIDSSGLETYDESFRRYLDKAKGLNQTMRLGSEAEVSAAALFLLSAAASFVTGTCLRVDGGESLYHPLMPPIAVE